MHVTVFRKQDTHIHVFTTPKKQYKIKQQYSCHQYMYINTNSYLSSQWFGDA